MERVQKGVQSLDCIKMVVTMNRYGHPHAEVLEGLEQAGVKACNLGTQEREGDGSVR